MTKKVAIVGIDTGNFAKKFPELRFKELMFESVKRVHNSTGLTNKDIQSVITTGEDFAEGRAIADEFTPDQIGGVLKPNIRICADSIYGLFTGYMQIVSGLFDIVLIVGYDKPSEVLDHNLLTSNALDPIFSRPIKSHPLTIAALEMQRFMFVHKISREEIAKIIVKNKKNALANSRALFGGKISPDDVLKSDIISSPLSQIDVAPSCDGVATVVLASEKTAKKITDKPVWIRGIGWGSDSSSAFWSKTDFSQAGYIKTAVQMAYKMAKIKNPKKEINFAEVDDRFSYKELLHIEALGVFKGGQTGKLLVDGVFSCDGKFPINPSGGSLGMGYLHNAAGLARVAEVCLQLNGTAGKNQLKNVDTGLALGWSGLPSRSGGVVILSL